MTPQELKAIREKAGLTQEKMAEELGLTGQTVYRWEAGTCKVSKAMEQLIRIKYNREGRK